MCDEGQNFDITKTDNTLARRHKSPPLCVVLTYTLEPYGLSASESHEIQSLIGNLNFKCPRVK